MKKHLNLYTIILLALVLILVCSMSAAFASELPPDQISLTVINQTSITYNDDYTAVSGSFYYIVEFGFPGELTDFQMGWKSGANASSPEMWENIRPEDLEGNDEHRYIIALPPEDGSAAIETLFVRANEESTVTKLTLNYETQNKDENISTSITNTKDPDLMTPFVLSWNEYENAEFYIVEWEMPNGMKWLEITKVPQITWTVSTDDQEGRPNLTGFIGNYTAKVTPFVNNKAGKTAEKTFTISAPKPAAGKLLAISVHSLNKNALIDGEYPVWSEVEISVESDTLHSEGDQEVKVYVNNGAYAEWVTLDEEGKGSLIYTVGQENEYPSGSVSYSDFPHRK